MILAEFRRWLRYPTPGCWVALAVGVAAVHLLFVALSAKNTTAPVEREGLYSRLGTRIVIRGGR